MNGDESIPTPKEHLFPGYNETKRQAEELVLAANGRSLACGQCGCNNSSHLKMLYLVDGPTKKTK